MSGDILAIDVGTSSLKLGVFSPQLKQRCEARSTYVMHLYGRGAADIDPELWWQAIRSSLAKISSQLADVTVVSLSVTTPGLTPMDADGRAVAPAVLFLDGRSHKQAAAIRSLVGEERFLEDTCNLPVSGGSSLASILWFRDCQPDVWRRTAVFGHSNTYITKRMTGHWAVDPSTVSITGLYNTARDDLTWNRTVLDLAGLSEDRLPPLMRSHDAVGRILPEIAADLGLPEEAVVLCGGNDAVLAALSGGLVEPGDINISSGTCDIVNVCTDRPVASPNFNVRTHVLPGRWLTFFVLNTGGEALEWFRSRLCRELDNAQFYDKYLPRVLEGFFSSPRIDEWESELPRYVPYLGGSRYSLDRERAGFDGLTLQTTRDDLLLSVIRGNLIYLGGHLDELASLMPLSRTVGISGGGARMPGMIAARRRWTGDYDYVFQDQSSLRGAAILGGFHETGIPSDTPSSPSVESRRPVANGIEPTLRPRGDRT